MYLRVLTLNYRCNNILANDKENTEEDTVEYITAGTL